jgi:hypothetical protein
MASDQIIVAGVAWAVIGVAIAVAAALKGRPFLPWLLYAVAFWPLALIHLIFWKPRIPGSGPLDDEPGS